MKRKEKHDLKVSEGSVSEGEGMKKRQPNKKEFLNKTSDEQSGSQMKFKHLRRLGYKRGVLQSNKFTATGKKEKENQIQQG